MVRISYNFLWWWGGGVGWGVGLKVVTLSKKVVTFLWERKGLYGKERDTGVNGKGCESITFSFHTPFFLFYHKVFILSNIAYAIALKSLYKLNPTTMLHTIVQSIKAFLLIISYLSLRQ
jgi:hypothetical protein